MSEPATQQQHAPIHTIHVIAEASPLSSPTPLSSSPSSPSSPPIAPSIIMLSPRRTSGRSNSSISDTTEDEDTYTSDTTEDTANDYVPPPSVVVITSPRSPSCEPPQSPVSSREAASREAASSRCIICLDVVVPSSPTRAEPLLPHPRDLCACECKYEAHAACLREWCAYRQECPMCREPVESLVADELMMRVPAYYHRRHRHYRREYEQQHLHRPHRHSYVIAHHWITHGANDCVYSCARYCQASTFRCICLVAFGVLFSGWVIVCLIGCHTDPHQPCLFASTSFPPAGYANGTGLL